MATWETRKTRFSFKTSIRRSDVVVPEDGETREDVIWELRDLEKSDHESTGNVEESSTTGKLLLAIADAWNSILGVHDRLTKEMAKFKINGEQASYLKLRLLWGVRLDRRSNFIPWLQQQASISRSARWRAECDEALLFCANSLGELGRIMRIGEALLVDCVGSTKDWQQLVVLESILASRSSLVQDPEKPFWSPFFLVLRDFHSAHILIEKAIAKLEEICECSFTCIPPATAQAAREHRFNEDKRYCWSNAVKDTENIFKECRQHVKGNKKTTKSRCANYMLNKLKFVDQLVREARGGASNPSLPELLQIDDQDLVGTSEQFASGSYGYVVERNWMNILVAVKTMHLEIPEDTKFNEEVSLLSRVEHPHVVRMVGYCTKPSGGGQERPKNKVVMEKMSGDLRNLMDKILEKNKESVHLEFDRVPFPPPVALDLILQLAEALRYLHIRRVMHRDIKAKNILVNSRHLQPGVVPPLLDEDIADATKQLQYYHIKLTDMGLAKHKLPDNSLYSSKMQGSTNWRAPEVFNENPDKYTWSADIYSFGITSYEIVSGKVPMFCGRLTVTHPLLCAGERPPMPSNCQPELADLIRRCWATDPRERPSIFQVCNELQNCKEALLRRRLVRQNASALSSVSTR